MMRYLGTKRRFLNVKSPERDNILQEAKQQIDEMSPEEIERFLDDLILSDTFEFINFAGKLMANSTKARSRVTLSKLKQWLAPTTGWAECDSLCQSLFGETEVIERWSQWSKTIDNFSSDKNIQIRRASLVLQCKSVRKSNDPRLRKLAFGTIDKLKDENSVLITKAVSWLLRSLAASDSKDVLIYLKANKLSLPKIAYRETLRKIETGKK